MRRAPSPKQRLLHFSADAVNLIHRKTGEVCWTVKWKELEEIFAFKVNAVVVDHICLGFRREGDTDLVVTDEETPGWTELNEHLASRFDVSFQRWFGDVAFPAFVENRRLLWSRRDGSCYPPSREDELSQSFDSFVVTFDGGVLRRGFWLYVVELRGPNGTFAYVGRTGDTSSPNAASLFARIASHLDLKANAKGNALLRRLKQQQMAWEDYSFRFLGIGPLFAEQQSMAAHRPIRDEMAGLERAVADTLKDRGYVVLGEHPKPRDVRPALLRAVMAELQRLL